MVEVKLSNDADYMLCKLYAEYQDRRKNGIPKDEAQFFGGAELIQSTLIPEWPVGDITATARELEKVGFLSILIADMQLTESALLPDAIIYMENRFKGKVSDLLETLSKLRAIIFS